MIRLIIICTVLLLSISNFAQTHKTELIRYDGIYQTVSDIDSVESDTTNYYLRFYPNGKVISISTDGTVLDVKKWFNINHKDIPTGNFEIKDKRLYFSTTSSTGTIIYDGKIVDDYYLELTTKSLINNYSSIEKYYFIRIPGLK